MTDWEQGIRALRQGRLREAADRLNSAAADHERTVSQAARFQTLTHLGAALYGLGKAPEAVQAFEDACRLAPAPAPSELLVNLANAYLAAGNRDDARRVLESALEDYPGNLEAQVLLGRLSRHDGTAPLSGSPLGDSPSGVLRYLRTLQFSAVSSGGFDPAQVRLAMAHIERYVEFLVLQIISRDEKIAHLEYDLASAQEALDAALGAEDATAARPDPDTPALTRLDALLRKKPRH